MDMDLWPIGNCQVSALLDKTKLVGWTLEANLTFGTQHFRPEAELSYQGKKCAERVERQRARESRTIRAYSRPQSLTIRSWVA